MHKFLLGLFNSKNEEKVTGALAMAIKAKKMAVMAAVGGAIFFVFIVIIAVSYIISPYIKLAAEVTKKVENFTESLGNLFTEGCWGVDKTCEEKAMKDFLKKVEKVDKTYIDGKRHTSNSLNNNSVTLDLALLISPLVYDQKNDGILGEQLKDESDDNEWASEKGYTYDEETGKAYDKDGEEVKIEDTNEIDWDNIDTDDGWWIFGDVSWYAGIGDDEKFVLLNAPPSDSCEGFKYTYEVICKAGEEERDGKPCGSTGDKKKWPSDVSDLRYLAKKMVKRVGVASCEVVSSTDGNGNVTKRSVITDKFEYKVDKDFFKEQLIEFYIPEKYKKNFKKLSQKEIKNKSSVIANRMFDMATLYEKILKSVRNNSDINCEGNYGSEVSIDIDSQYISKLKIQVLKPGCKNADCNDIQEIVDLKDYVMGVAYREIGVSMGTPKEQLKAQIIAAKSYTLGRRPNSMTKDGDNYYKKMQNSTNDQVYCNIEKGCKNESSNARPAPDSKVKKYLSDAYNETENEFLYDIGSKQFVGLYNATVAGCDKSGFSGFCMGQTEARNMANEGKDYKNILATFYTNKIGIYDIKNSNISSSFQDCSTGSIGGIKYPAGAFGEINYYCQKDYKQQYGSFGPHVTIAEYGCGTTSMSIVVSSMLKKPYDPVFMTNWACKMGYCTISGTKYTFFAAAADNFGLKSEQVGKDKESLQKITNALGSGKSLVITLAGPSKFTTAGHYIVLTAVDNNGKVLVADPYTPPFNRWWDFSYIVQVAKDSTKPFWIITKP